MIFTFYSYKGGAGRSMALANIAQWFYSKGLRVVMIDWDLEAPGLENFFFISEKELENVRCQLGLIDMLTAYKRRFPRLLISANETDSKKVMTILEANLQPIKDMLYPIYLEDNDNREKSSGKLSLIPAGLRYGDHFSSYSQTVQSFDWNDFYTSFQGEAYFEWMRSQLLSNDLADVVLIDSRTGVTEMGGVCTRQLADVVVSFCVPNTQNITGVATMVKSFQREELLQFRKNRSLEVVVVPTRLDSSEIDARN